MQALVLSSNSLLFHLKESQKTFVGKSSSELPSSAISTMTSTGGLKSCLTNFLTSNNMSSRNLAIISLGFLTLTEELYFRLSWMPSLPICMD